MKRSLSNQAVLMVDEKDLTFETFFKRVLTDFSETPSTPFSLLETIILSCVVIEAIIKTELKSINPVLILDKIEPENVAILSGKSKKLIATPSAKSSDIKTSSISVLIERYSKFKNLSEYQESLVAFFRIRNKIVHSAEQAELNEDEISILLTRKIFPFIKSFVNTPQNLWEDIEKIAGVVENRYRRNLARVILKFRRKASGLLDFQLKEALQGEPELDEHEDVDTAKLLCPACGNYSMFLISGVDFEYEDGDTSAYGYRKALCNVCGLELDVPELEEIMNNPDDYFSPQDEDLSNWGEALNYYDSLYESGYD